MSWTICVTNPSPYERHDYVEVNLQKLGVPPELNESNLRLFRVNFDRSRYEIPFQIDSVLGHDSPVRILTFLSTQTPASAEDYSQFTAEFELEEGTPTDFSTERSKAYLRIDHYYEQPDANKGDAPFDGYNKDWDPNRSVYGVKIHNGQLRFYVSLVPHPRVYSAIDYAGSVTSIEFQGDPDPDNDLLSPFEKNRPEKRWGQLYQLIFFPVPWALDWFTIISLKGKKYDLIWSHCGNIGSTITMRSSEPILLEYKCLPYCKPAKLTLECYLYRVIHVYPDKPFYLEDIFVLTKEGLSISFRPYFEAEVIFSKKVHKNIVRFEEDIPDYFSLWNCFAGVARGYGFAADSHIRRLEIGKNDSEQNMIRWRLQDTHHNRCINFFMYHGVDCQDYNPYHEIGHYAWYEHILKPLETFPYEMFTTAKRYIPLQSSD